MIIRQNTVVNFTKRGEKKKYVLRILQPEIGTDMDNGRDTINTVTISSCVNVPSYERKY